MHEIIAANRGKKMGEISIKEVAIWGTLFFAVGIAANFVSEYAWHTYLLKQKEKVETARLAAIRAAQIRKGNSYTAAHSARIIEGDRRY